MSVICWTRRRDWYQRRREIKCSSSFEVIYLRRFSLLASILKCQKCFKIPLEYHLCSIVYLFCNHHSFVEFKRALICSARYSLSSTYTSCKHKKIYISRRGTKQFSDQNTNIDINRYNIWLNKTFFSVGRENEAWIGSEVSFVTSENKYPVGYKNNCLLRLSRNLSISIFKTCFHFSRI